MEDFYERLVVAAATIDELLSEDFEPLPGQKTDTDRAARRLAAWCRACASGDWRQFARRLHRDGWNFAQVLERFASVRRTPGAPTPIWIQDAIWILSALTSPQPAPAEAAETTEAVAFQHLLTPLVHAADARAWSHLDAPTARLCTDTARASLRHSLLQQLSQLCAPPLYALFDNARTTATTGYPQFVTDMAAHGFVRLFQAKPVLLRLIATLTRQWIDTTTELLTRLSADLPTIGTELLHTPTPARVTHIHSNLGDHHNGGRSVHIVVFEDGSRIVYKPKDLRVDVAWHTLIDRLNHATPPIDLRAPRALARDGYGWTEFIDHAGCPDQHAVERYFHRAGAWLALFYCFAAGDMHHENLIAAGDHPVPIDIETILQARIEWPAAIEPESQATNEALKIIADSAMVVGLIPSYELSPDNQVFAVGGLISQWNVKTPIRWTEINTDGMRPTRPWENDPTTPNLPHIGGRYAKFTDHLDAFVTGFEDYARFLAGRRADSTLFEGFAGLPVRKVPRPTKFYSMLLERLTDHRSMDDGATWSAQADFVVRLADWDNEPDPGWPLLRAERAALASLNVPFLWMSSDDTDIRDAAGVLVRAPGVSGLQRTRDRSRNLSEQEIDWQVTVIRQNMESFIPQRESAVGPEAVPGGDDTPGNEMFTAEADAIAAELSRDAIRRGPGVAWIALDWPGDSEAFQLVCLGWDLYNGATGIGLFLAAHAAVSGCTHSGELARAAVAELRKKLRGRDAARAARAVGIGGGSGLGSIVYGLAVMSKCLGDNAMLDDAHNAAELITDDLIAADNRLDVIGGSAGAILGLLRLYRDTGSRAALARANRCGENLLRKPRIGSAGRRSWTVPGTLPRDVNGMSHGAAGFAYAMAALAQAAGCDEFADAATECIAFENASYDPRRHTWPNLRDDGEMEWPCQWCHGAPGIGLARIAIAGVQGANVTTRLTHDIRRAVAAVEEGWPGQQRDTLCCGALGSVEFLHEAATTLGQNDLRALATRRLAGVLSAAGRRGDYRWNAGTRRFNPGLFRGLAGVGYTALREVDESLPNVLLWE